MKEFIDDVLNEVIMRDLTEKVVKNSAVRFNSIHVSSLEAKGRGKRGSRRVHEVVHKIRRNLNVSYDDDDDEGRGEGGRGANINFDLAKICPNHYTLTKCLVKIKEYSFFY